VVRDRNGQVYLRYFSGRWGPVVSVIAGGDNRCPSVLADRKGVDVVWTHRSQPEAMPDEDALYHVRIPLLPGK
jgi:hypothetical protein